MGNVSNLYLWVRVRLEEQTYPFPLRKITSATMFNPPVIHVRQVFYPSLVTIHSHFITDHRGNYCLSVVLCSIFRSLAALISPYFTQLYVL